MPSSLLSSLSLAGSPSACTYARFWFAHKKTAEWKYRKFEKKNPKTSQKVFTLEGLWIRTSALETDLVNKGWDHATVALFWWHHRITLSSSAVLNDNRWENVVPPSADVDELTPNIRMELDGNTHECTFFFYTASHNLVIIYNII